MDRITASLLNEFSREHDLTALPEDDRFEHFASFVTVRRQYGETFDTSDVVLGKTGGIGIDAIAVIINGSLIADIDTFNELADEANYLDVTFIFVQADRGPSFEVSKMGNFGFAVADFLRQPQLSGSEELKEAAALMSAIYDRSSKFKRANPACRLYCVTRTGRFSRGDIEPSWSRRSPTAIRPDQEFDIS